MREVRESTSEIIPTVVVGEHKWGRVGIKRRSREEIFNKYNPHSALETKDCCFDNVVIYIFMTKTKMILFVVEATPTH